MGALGNPFLASRSFGKPIYSFWELPIRSGKLLFFTYLGSVTLGNPFLASGSFGKPIYSFWELAIRFGKLLRPGQALFFAFLASGSTPLGMGSSFSLHFNSGARGKFEPPRPS